MKGGFSVERIAIISDVHGNIPALEAVFDDIHQRKISRIFCLGDMVGKGPNSDIALDLVKKNCEMIVLGNWDDFITKESEYEAARWHQKVLGKERLEYISTLPFSFEFFMSGKYIRLFHASPRSLYERIQPWDNYEKRMSLFDYSEFCKEEKQADVVGYGDIHNAYMQNLDEKILFNVGSVGNPLGLTQASYVIIEGKYGDLTLAPLNIQFVRVPYDIELAIQQAIDVDMPSLEPYIKELRTGKYRGNID
jgi:protein phosphatase